MINYPNALQQPPSGVTLPERFVPLTQPTGSSSSSALNGAVARTNGTSSSNSSVSAIDPSQSSTKNSTLLVDPKSSGSLNSSFSDPSLTSNVGQHVLNGQGEVDGSAFGLGRADQANADNQGLSPGAKAGAVAGTLVTAFILIAIAFVAKRIHRSAKTDRQSVMIERQRSASLTEHGSDYVIHPH